MILSPREVGWLSSFFSLSLPVSLSCGNQYETMKSKSHGLMQNPWLLLVKTLWGMEDRDEGENGEVFLCTYWYARTWHVDLPRRILSSCVTLLDV